MTGSEIRGLASPLPQRETFVGAAFDGQEVLVVGGLPSVWSRREVLVEMAPALMLNRGSILAAL